MEYDTSRDIIVLAGVRGVSLWRLSRPTIKGSGHVMERLYVFEELADVWVGRCQLELRLGHVYALAERSAYVLSVESRHVVYRMKDIHEFNVTCVCWYGRSQFYLTGSSSGEIKCWTPFHYQRRGFRGSTTSSFLQSSSSGSQDNKEDNTLTLLHTFNIHTASIAGISLHPTSGMAISASMDGVIRILNLEMFTEIYSINLHGRPIMRMVDIALPPAPNSLGIRQEGAPPGRGILFTHADDNSVNLWRITSCAGFFGISSSDVISLRKFENFHVPVTFKALYSNPHVDTRITAFGSRVISKEEKQIIKEVDAESLSKEQLQQQAYEKYLTKKKEIADRKAQRRGEHDGMTKTMIQVASAFASGVTTFKMDEMKMRERIHGGHLDEGHLKNNPEVENEIVVSDIARGSSIDKSRSGDGDEFEKDLNKGEFMTQEEALKLAIDKVKNTRHGFQTSKSPVPMSVPPKLKPDLSKAPMTSKSQPTYMQRTYIASLAGRDLRLFTGKGKSITSVDPDVVVSGIVCYTVSVFQNMVFVLLESGAINVYCARSGSIPGEWSSLLRSLPDWARGSVNVERETVVCMSLIDVMPVEKPVSTEENNLNRDLRGEKAPVDIDEVIVLGCCSGSLVFLDTLNECRVVCVIQGHQTGITQMQYRHVRKELFTSAPFSSSIATISVYP